MRELWGIARVKFHEGKVDEFKRLSAQLMESARTKDTGTLLGDLRTAWDAVWDLVPDGWTVARPRWILVNGQWYVSAVLVTGPSRIGKMPKAVTA